MSDSGVILYGEIRCWSLLGVQGLGQKAAFQAFSTNLNVLHNTSLEYTDWKSRSTSRWLAWYKNNKISLAIQNYLTENYWTSERKITTAKLRHLARYQRGKTLSNFPICSPQEQVSKNFLGIVNIPQILTVKKLSKLVRITIWVIGLLLLNFTLWISRNSRHHLNKLGAKLNLLSLICHWHHLEFPFMTLHPNALYQGTIPVRKKKKKKKKVGKLF